MVQFEPIYRDQSWTVLSIESRPLFVLHSIKSNDRLPFYICLIEFIIILRDILMFYESVCVGKCKYCPIGVGYIFWKIR